MKTKKTHKKIQKVPSSAKEEPKEVKKSSYSEEPVKKGKTHYEEDEESEEESAEI